MDGRRRASVVGAVATCAVLVVAAPAEAHVTVHTDQPARGASDAAVMFRTPNEEDHAATVKLQVYFPRNHPLLDVLVETHPGWHFTVKSARLRRTVTTDDGTITSAVSEVTWTADDRADGLQPGEADDFVVIAGQLPATPTVTFRALQTYSNGDVVKWIETQAPGADEPDHPAPVLRLSKPGRETSTVRAGAGGHVATQPTSSGDGIDRGLAIGAAVISLIALGFGIRARSIRG